MKAAWLFIASELLLVLMMVSVFANWQGNVNLQAGSALASFVFEITGGTKGGWVVLALICLIAAAVTFVAGLAVAMKSSRAARS